MAKISSQFKETVKQVAITVFINAIGNALKTIGEVLVVEKKFDKEGVSADNGKI